MHNITLRCNQGTMDDIATEQKQLKDVRYFLSTFVRAFYHDEAIVLVDYLLRHAFLKEGREMGKSSGLHLSSKQIRRTLQFLRREHIVAIEEVSSLVETRGETRTYRRKKTAHFWYIDYNRAFHSIRLRLHLMQQQLTETRNQALGSNRYKCPGHAQQRCPYGQFSEMEAQSCPMDPATGLFLCTYCVQQFGWTDSGQQGLHSFVLELDHSNTQDAHQAEVLLSRLQKELSPSESLARPGVWSLINCIQSFQKPIPSNLPLENGAVEHLTSSQEEYVSFLDEFSNELAGLGYFRNALGQPVALELVEPLSLWVHPKQFNLALDDEQRLVQAAVKIHDAERANLKKAALMDPPSEIPRPEKMTCRQTTPFFLRNNIGNSTIEEVFSEPNTVPLSEETRRSSFEENDLFSSVDTAFSWASPPPAAGDELPFFRQFDLQLERQKATLGLTRTRSERQISGCSFASVDWEG